MSLKSEFLNLHEAKFSRWIHLLSQSLHSKISWFSRFSMTCMNPASLPCQNKQIILNRTPLSKLLFKDLDVILKCRQHWLNGGEVHSEQGIEVKMSLHSFCKRLWLKLCDGDWNCFLNSVLGIVWANRLSIFGRSDSKFLTWVEVNFVIAQSGWSLFDLWLLIRILKKESVKIR